MATFNDNEKVRMNAVRIYGNLLRLINENQLTNKRWQSICLEAIKNVCEQAKIVATGSNVKVKWNACYAIGNFMKNAAIFDLDGGNEMCWQVTKKKLKYFTLMRWHAVNTQTHNNMFVCFFFSFE